MKKSSIVEKVMCVIGVVLLVWFIASWVDVVADNTEPNPHHYAWNVFVLMTKEAPEENENGTCGNPITDTIRIECAECTSIEGDVITFRTEDGNLWEWQAGYTDDFSIDYYYCLFFDTLGNTDITDDELVKVFREIS